VLPLLYFVLGHLSLAFALGAVALDPAGVAGFFYNPRMLAVVHLVTLGWISASILGSIYVVGPLALRLPLPARRLDYVAFVLFAVGLSGMVSHFWLDRPAGMVWSASLVALAFIWVAQRVLRGLGPASVPREVKLPVALAFLNILAAASLGLVLGVNKVAPFLPVSHLDVVLAHAHLAVLGWATMMVMGAGYRMLPMILPAAMPRGRWVYASAILLELGTFGLVLGFLLGGRFLGLSAVVTAAGLLAFFSRLVFMLRNPRPAPAERRKPDLSVGHALQALAYLALTLVLGFVLAFAPASEWTLRAAMAYGAFGLLGFLAQIVVGVEGRILPLVAWLWSFADTEFKGSPPSLHRTPVRVLQVLILLAWTLGVPLLTAGLTLDRTPVLAFGSGLLCAAVVASVANLGVVLARSRAASR